MTRKQLVSASRTSEPKFDPNDHRRLQRMLRRALDDDHDSWDAPSLREAERAVRRIKRKRG